MWRIAFLVIGVPIVALVVMILALIVVIGGSGGMC